MKRNNHNLRLIKNLQSHEQANFRQNEQNQNLNFDPNIIPVKATNVTPNTLGILKLVNDALPLLQQEKVDYSQIYVTLEPNKTKILMHRYYEIKEQDSKEFSIKWEELSDDEFKCIQPKT